MPAIHSPQSDKRCLADDGMTSRGQIAERGGNGAGIVATEGLQETVLSPFAYADSPVEEDHGRVNFPAMGPEEENQSYYAL